MGDHPPSIYPSSHCTLTKQQLFYVVPPQLNLVILLLDQITLTKCVRVNKEWNADHMPSCGKSSILRPTSNLGSSLATSYWRHSKNASNVQTLSMCLLHRKLLCVLVPHLGWTRVALCTNIRSLDTCCVGHTMSLLPKFLKPFLCLLGRIQD